jgi:outer membrane protein assembly factor BamB
VALSAGKALVGAYQDDDFGSASGSAYIFDATNGAQLRKFTADDAAAGDGFGVALAISGNTALIGAPGDDDRGSNSGSAYLFDVNSGQQLRKLQPTDATAGFEFGISVAIKGNIALVSAALSNGQAGSAYMFDVSTGVQLAKLIPSDGAAGDWFGNSVALDGASAIVAAVRDDGHTGSAYLFGVTSVPEPTSGSFLVLGLGVSVWIRIRRCRT